ncbi:ribonuclease T2-like isoform X2 [Takifugu flavidus]|uniref:Uncharacterized protein n=1 Tax=Takifugu flavidus TaxID=433684 RepID=A0A5C6PH56_9TELE|nr:ribonuclease T2-like isoform X2 [Takifugu flavidus]TWW77727.1 hypothetical protein D4764_12G0011170 [Takifugu flavidus]
MFLDRWLVPRMQSSALPLLVSVSSAALFLLQLPDNADAQEVLLQDYKYGRSQGDTTSCSWRCLLLTLQWPGAFCQSLGEGRVCQIPPSVNHWTLHGLWPVREDRCCDCWPMFHSDVQEVEAELLVHWPSLLRHNSSFQFWRNEWRKHGSCAACVEGINSPLRYFQLCLKLRRQFNIDQVLEDAGITPSCHRTYKVSEVRRVLVPHVGDIHEIQCVRDKQDREVWFQIKIPLSRNLTVGCSPAADAEADWRSSGGHPCPPQVPFFYLPINHEQPKEPCG